MACKQVEAVDYVNAPVLTSTGNTFLYQAYLGRISGVKSFDVFVDDSAYKINSASPTLQGDVNRTCYDGISFADVNVVISVADNEIHPVNFRLNQNYPNPFNPTTKILYSISKSNFVTLKIYDVLGREIQTLVNRYQEPNRYSIDFNASRLASGVYCYRLQAGSDLTETKKMVLIKQVCLHEMICEEKAAAK